MSKQQFTNRHGRKMHVADDAEDKSKQQSSGGSQSPNPKSRPKRTLLRIHFGKRFILISLAVLVAAFIAVLVMADSAKRDYEHQSAAMRRSVFDRSRQTVSNETSAVTTIRELRQALTVAASCRAGLDVVNWYGPAQVARERCQATANSYKDLQQALDDMKTATEYIARVNAALDASLSMPTDGGFAVIDDYATSWEKSFANISSLTPPRALAAAHTELFKKTSGIKDAWTALRNANNAHKADDFRSAEKTLGERYDELRSTQDGLQAVIDAVQELINRYVRQIQEG